MSLNKLIIIFGIILAIFAGVVFFQFRAKPNNKSISQKSPTSSISINGRTFKIEIAKTLDEQQVGLSERDSLPQDQGMLFVYDKPDFYNFWMKNMKFPLDIIFIRDNKVVSVAQSAFPPGPNVTNPPLIKPDGMINKVLEVNSGISKKYNIKKGDKVDINL